MTCRASGAEPGERLSGRSDWRWVEGGVPHLDLLLCSPPGRRYLAPAGVCTVNLTCWMFCNSPCGKQGTFPWLSPKMSSFKSCLIFLLIPIADRRSVRRMVVIMMMSTSSGQTRTGVKLFISIIMQLLVPCHTMRCYAVHCPAHWLSTLHHQRETTSGNEFSDYNFHFHPGV